MKEELISVIIPVYNEAQSLSALFARLFPVMNAYSHEIIFVNDGSKDESLAILLREQKKNSCMKVIDLNGNFGQHMAIMAGFEICKGSLIITMDADLQNPPEEIPKIINEFKNGHDVIGTIRMKRKDTFFRRTASRIVNRIMNRMTSFTLSDYGCMLRGYSREIVDIINEAKETSTFIPALAQKFAVNPVEIEIAHSEREYGESKYSIFRLIRLYFDLMTAFSLVPLQLMTILGMIMFAAGCVFLNVNVILSGVNVTCIGIMGEYVGRIYQEVRKRPRYVIRKIYAGDDNA